MFAALASGRKLTFDRASGAFLDGEQAGDGRLVLSKLPRIGVYAPWSGSMDEGWLRWVFDTWKLPYVGVRNEMVRAVGLAQFLDVLVLPDVGAGTLDDGRAPGSVPSEFARGLDPEGAVAIEEFVRGGGRLVTFGGASAWASSLFEFPLVDVTREKPKEGANDFSCPGGVLRGIADPSPYTEGLPDSVALFFAGSSAWRVEPRKDDPRELRTLLRFAPTRVLLSGWIRSSATIEDRAAWVRATHGRGAVHLFSFSPHYRGWSQQAFQLLFRALLLDVPR